ncbi:wax ester/triacylglycerol synthase domain-containing protein [Mycobacterium sp. GA-2829]|uniref:wax ester/triacylglycerol synthase domain-containing protein n=1 Tax=Mycobacterium sp. GA-2829 TaxID=1772283 RepID=UPI0007404875|nr:wax ester/triacylglycerol synthase domain-containing protein [Mycobacterium sp. GA-2829]KUI32611.1 hypothetical protein AU194_24980 [Mycobacterium sp. GA-2829]
MPSFLRGADAFIWSVGADPRLRPTIVTLTVLDRCPDWAVLVERFQALSAAVPAFRRCVAPSPGPLPPRWRDDPDFDIAFHVRRVAAPHPHNLDTVVDMARLAAMSDFDLAHPLWEVVLVEGLDDGKAALLCKLHHALADGTGAVAMATHLFDHSAVRRPDRAGAHGDRPPGPRPHPLLPETLRALTGPWALGASLMRTVLTTGGPRSPIMRTRSTSRCLAVYRLPEAALRAAGHAAGGSLNDAFLAAITDALHRYHDRHGSRLEKALLMMPISIRGPADPAGGNRTMLMRFDVPVGPGSVADRIREIHRRTHRVRAERAVTHAPLVATALSVTPHGYVSSALRTVDFIASDVPGIPTPVTLAGARVDMQYAFSPTLGAAFNVTLLTYAGECGIGVNVDTAAVPDIDVFFECVAAGFDRVRDFAGQAAAGR